MSAKKTYYTKADLISFARYIVSDERRGLKQREAREKHEAGIINFMPWSVAERVIEEGDFKAWKEKQEK